MYLVIKCEEVNNPNDDSLEIEHTFVCTTDDITDYTGFGYEIYDDTLECLKGYREERK